MTLFAHEILCARFSMDYYHSIHTHHRFDPDEFELYDVGEDAYLANRSHQERNALENAGIKQHEPIWAPKVDRISRQSARDENLRRCIVNQFDRQVTKAIGFNGEGHEHPATTGTSMPNTLCVTSGMSSCIAVAIGGEKFNADGEPIPGAKVRVFHIYPGTDIGPGNTAARADIEKYIAKLQAEGLQVKAAMHGGDYRLAYSNRLAKEMRDLFIENPPFKESVKLEFDETCEKRGKKTPLGVIIEKDRVVFKTEVAAVVD